MKKAIILLSGGLDSATCLAIAKSKAYECYALSFRYGQKHSSELEAAKKLALAAQVKMHKTIDLDLGSFGGSALTDSEIDVPTYQVYDSAKLDSTELETAESKTAEQENYIPVTYVPARNTVFLSIALAWAEVLQADIIMAGVNAVDYSGYPDCRPEYIEAFQKMADLATKAGIEGKGVKLDVPLINMSKVEIIRKGYSLGVDYSQTISCYQADESGAACGVCDSCIIRKEAFQNAIQKDPTKYV